MADIRIDSLPVANYQQPLDMFALQRNVGGVWTDFRSNFAAMSGDVQIAIIQWDLDNPGSPPPIGTIVTPGVDEIAVYLSATLYYTPDGLPSGDAVSIQITDNVSAIAQVDFSTNGTSGGFTFYDLAETSAMDTPMKVDQSVGGSPNGTAKVIVQYLIVRL